jgi:hypothetical protein
LKRGDILKKVGNLGNNPWILNNWTLAEPDVLGIEI